MIPSVTPESVVQQQLDAFNARDIEALMATYAEDAQQIEHPATLLASGAAQLRERTAARFQESNLHARLIQRIVMGSVVIDHEEVTRTFPEGPGRIELVATYEVRDGRIATARFIYGAKTLEPKSCPPPTPRVHISNRKTKPLKAYLITTGTVFGLIVLAHVWRVFVDGWHLASDPVFVFLTIFAAALSVWAWRLLGRPAR